MCNAEDPDSIPGSGRSPGEENGNLLQYSCCENSRHRGALQATVHGVAKNLMQLNDFHSLIKYFRHRLRFWITLSSPKEIFLASGGSLTGKEVCLQHFELGWADLWKDMPDGLWLMLGFLPGPSSLGGTFLCLPSPALWVSGASDSQLGSSAQFSSLWRQGW